MDEAVLQVCKTSIFGSHPDGASNPFLREPQPPFLVTKTSSRCQVSPSRPCRRLSLRAVCRTKLDAPQPDRFVEHREAASA